MFVVDNFCSSRWENIEDLVKLPGIELIRHDVSTPFYLDVDEIYHLACPASPLYYQLDPVQTTKTCVYGTINVLDLAQRLNVRTLLASTSEVYGDSHQHPQQEAYWGNVNPIGIRSCYDEGKRCAESLFFDYWRQHQLSIKVARIFNTYGPRMLANDGRVVSTFIVQALQNEDLTIFGDGEQTRSLCYVDDLVEGLIRLMETDVDVTGPINIGNPQELTMLELAQRVLLKTGSSGGLIHMPLPADDPLRRRPDITMARDVLGWAPTTDLDAGLDSTIAYFRDVLRSGLHPSRD